VGVTKLACNNLSFTYEEISNSEKLCTLLSFLWPNDWSARAGSQAWSETSMASCNLTKAEDLRRERQAGIVRSTF
jgi:hypothetical protein